jgi:signal peptidase I
MEPNYKDGELVIVDRTRYTFGIPQRGDVIGLKFPGQPTKKKFIKRIVGLPGEHIKITGKNVFIDGKKYTEDYLPLYLEQNDYVDVTIAQDQYFVMGDNRGVSSDSRKWGTVPRKNIVGRAYLRIWPIEKIGLVEHFKSEY